MPTPGKPAAITALPQPPSTSHSVPMNSAISLEAMIGVSCVRVQFRSVSL